MTVPTRILCIAVALSFATACGSASDVEEMDCGEWLPGDVVLTEFLADPEGADTGQEWLELHNPGSEALDLRGLTLYAARPDGSQEKAYTFDESVWVEAKGYVVLGDVRSGPLPAHVKHSYGESLGALGNSGGLIGLRCGDGVVDAVRYSGPLRAGVARAYDGRLVPDPSGNDDEARWCDAPALEGVRGSPGVANPACPETSGDPGTTPSGGMCLPRDSSTPRAVVPPRPGELVITELMVNPRGDDAAGEWVELLATAPVDLNGVVVGSGTTGTPLRAGHCLTLAPGEYALLARQVDPALNGGLPPPLAILGAELRNEGGTVVVRSGEHLIDSLTYEDVGVGKALQVSAGRLDAQRNDEPSSRCPATAPYGTAGNLGTPGQPNGTCPSGGSQDGDGGGAAPTCEDPVTRSVRPLRVASPGTLVLTEFMADPRAVPDATGEWVEVHALQDVDLNGVMLSNEGSGRTTLTSAQCLATKAGAYAVLARSADASVNGGLPPVLATFSFSLVNGAGARVLRLSREGTLLDEVAYTSAALPGVSRQLDPSRTDPERNDEPEGFCPSPEEARYGAGDRGTPGAENRSCAP